jgi:predicted dehydrogenase
MRRLGNVDVVAVASPHPERIRSKADRLGMTKLYSNFEELLDDPEIDVVDIATPTYLHHPMAMQAIARRKHVIVDKPLAMNAVEAEQLVKAAGDAGVVNAVTFNYRYNPLVQQARVMVARGDIGDVHLIRGMYLQEWLLHDTDFSWRLEPEKSGPAAMIADAGSHWFDLVEHVTGLRINSVLAELKTVIPVRHKPAATIEAFQSAPVEGSESYTVRVPDLGAALLRFSNDAVGTFVTSPLCAGHKNDLSFELHGSRASLGWEQEVPNRLLVGKRGEPDQVITKDPSLLDSSIRHYAALPGGHNEAWPDAFRNLLGNIFDFIASGQDPRQTGDQLFPTFKSGLRTVRIAEALLASGQAGGRWVEVEKEP